MMQGKLNLIHQQFVEKVKAGRGSRLKINADTFSGLFWIGKEAKTLGLIDGFGSAGDVARQLIHVKYIVDYTKKPSLLQDIMKML